MLYEFHDSRKKKGDVYATYIITGERKEVIQEAGDDVDEDEDMSGSPFEVTPREKKEEKFRYQKIVKLVGEERLEEVKAEIENIKTIHIYSLGPSRIKDLSVLSTCSDKVRTEFIYEDEQAAGRAYGMIVNRMAIKTPRPFRPFPPRHVVHAPAAPKVDETKANPDAKNKAKLLPETKTEKKSTPAQMKRSQSATKAAQKNPGQSNLFTSWGNVANKKAESDSSSAAHSPKNEEEPVRMDIDSEDEDDFKPNLLRDAAEDARKRRERDAELTKMMEMSDEDEDIRPKPKRRVKEKPKEEEEKEAEEEEEEEAQETPEKKPVELPAGSVVNLVTEGGRRRGRRKVNKKVQVKDEDGYLVTKFEPAWESFSEEEPAPKPKPKPKPAPKGKKKNAGPAPGQGDIGSYFFKK
ncbi:hypothetical protein L873DRAFT_1825800 [Choiromyces venosus 120613-1]|uniref:DNA polymerase delta subunit 3 n=1 Tax=Choiromyces venosus 120613-1 TaxID=1336337 RepID=A0A3N4K716_9PEZI|nr:hypothetical protein L873DRAFT_1825800 [Choiromyces venosus 120613-1]